MPLRRRLLLAVLLLALSPVPAAFAQAFPSKAVKVIVPFPPGGGADTLARIMGPYLTRIWGQAVIVENKPGASGHIGADAVAQSPADGYTLLMASTAALDGRNVKQFAPVTLTSASAYVIVANPKVKANTVKELIAEAKAAPGRLSFGSSGTGAASHLAGELFAAMAGIQLLHVPYKGTGQAVTDLLAGQIDLMFAPAQTAMPHVHAGKLKALAVTSAKRASALPNLPTAAESGLPGYEALGWFGLLAPVGTPRTIVEKLSTDANTVLALPEVKERLLALGSEPSGDRPDEFAAFIHADQAKWAKLMNDLGIKPQ
ncbi:MAG: tripartite tricarboxylate transporter substrate binding protein [Betaproteobacteria bacterium]|nr:tripartite tricarboxylate transporter substrate binding protein [Betaproteobacteria bacterium]